MFSTPKTSVKPIPPLAVVSYSPFIAPSARLTGLVDVPAEVELKDKTNKYKKNKEPKPEKYKKSLTDPVKMGLFLKHSKTLKKRNVIVHHHRSYNTTLPVRKTLLVPLPVLSSKSTLRDGKNVPGKTAIL